MWYVSYFLEDHFDLTKLGKEGGEILEHSSVMTHRTPFEWSLASRLGRSMDRDDSPWCFSIADASTMTGKVEDRHRVYETMITVRRDIEAGGHVSKAMGRAEDDSHQSFWSRKGQERYGC